MRFISDAISADKSFGALTKAIESGQTPVQLTGLTPFCCSAVIYSAAKALDKQVLVIVSDEAEANSFKKDLAALYETEPVLFLGREYCFHTADAASGELTHKRIRALAHIMDKTAPVVITTVDAILQYTVHPEKLKSGFIKLRSGMQFDIYELCKNLTAIGYVQCDEVTGVGQFSRRGGIIDIFSPTDDVPYRLEFWGDEIDTVYTFDPQTQRRLTEAYDAYAAPVSETSLAPEEAQLLVEELTALLQKLSRAKKEETLKFAHLLAGDIELLKNGILPESIDRYGALRLDRATLLDYFDEDTLVFSYGSARIRERAEQFNEQIADDVKAMITQGKLHSELADISLSPADFWELAGQHGIVLADMLPPGTAQVRLSSLFAFEYKQGSTLDSDVFAAAEEAIILRERGYSVVFACETPIQAQELSRELFDRSITAAMLDSTSALPPKGAVGVAVSPISGGFECIGAKVSVIPLVSKRAQLRKPKKRFTNGQKISGFTDLTPGDHVVHANYGIGVYLGIDSVTVDGITKDYIKIRYAGNDMLYVPANQLDMIAKYIGTAEDGKIKLNKMGTGDWTKLKQRTKSAVRDMAKELLALYSARHNSPGYKFSPDNEWQREFELAFEYEETDDQLRCIEEIKKDMESSAPMDRLLCGDVGFGKTEVALRAAFKAVQDSKQVAILAPTTILSWQHYQTILKRIEQFPIKVEVINRFRSPKQQQEILRKLRRGEIDIIIGTHRILQKDIIFRDLGLLIIDEEQRFGVAHKEKLKEIAKNVDVLTLSATPIPRTLNMAMSGIRDMSVLEEAPGERSPVQTYVMEYDEGAITEAIRRELRRGGQVFYLHNRVESIESKAASLLKLVPNARIAVAHGRMGEEELSDIWQDMVAGNIDILVCTTIIETGVDIPNANTLIIENADCFGLSQLHQTRGRVGRSARRAYAYFTYRKNKALNEIAEKRLTAIREYTEFGSGFKIAMRDLEIRGAGNILGGEQSGHMQAVGYDMYLKLLEEAVGEERGEVTPKTECSVDIQMNAFIPHSYIENDETRVDIYKKIAQIIDDGDRSELVDELIDRFGEPPKSVMSLMEIALLRNLAASLGINEITQKNGSIQFYLATYDKQAVMTLASVLKGRLRVNAGAKPYMEVNPAKASVTEVIRYVLNGYSRAVNAAQQNNKKEETNG